MDQLLSHTLRSAPFEHCCLQLAQKLSSKVSFPANSTYVATIDSYWSLQEANLSPTCIVVPETPQDVADAVSVLTAVKGCHFAIKGQSHAPAAGFANINRGVTIDMTGLKSVTVNADHTVASVGAGASWLDVYLYLDTLGLAVAGGRNGAVGVAGLTLGGGISYFAPQVGWACDNAANFEIVLASGKIANANATSNPDLFRALKGGANNFGVVTRLDLFAFPQGQILAGNLVHAISNRGAVFKAFSDIAGADVYDPYASLVTGLVFNATSKVWITSTTPIYTKPILDPPVYKEFLAIPSIVNTLHLTNLSVFADEPPTPKLNWLFYTGTYGVSADLLSAIFDICNATLYDFNIPEGILWSISLEPFPTVITKYGDSKGGNSLGTSPKDGNAFIMLIAGLWENTASNKQVNAVAQKLIKDIDSKANTMGLLHKFQYINYADPSQHPIQSYGEENVERLKKASRKYDPKGVFQKKVPGGFKLGL